jgi:hypothetical protein
MTGIFLHIFNRPRLNEFSFRREEWREELEFIRPTMQPSSSYKPLTGFRRRRRKELQGK